MALPFANAPASLPMNVLFPEAYRAACRMIVRDFAFFGCMIVGGVVTLAFLYG